MTSNLRDSGLESIGQIEWGTHLCQFYETAEDLLRIVVPYIAAGLRDNELCVWVTGGPVGEDDATQALEAHVADVTGCRASGQLVIADCETVYAPGNPADQRRILEGWQAKLTEALSAGYDGLRMTGNLFWMSTREEWRALAAYEAAVHRVMRERPVIALCTYNLGTATAEDVLGVLAHHHAALVRRHDGEQRLECGHDTGPGPSWPELVRAHEDLRLYAQIVANLSVGVALVRASDATFVYTNPKFEDMFGYQTGELVGAPVTTVNAPGERTPEEAARMIIAHLTQHGVWRGEMYNRRKDGRRFWCSASVSTFEHAEHGTMWVAVHTDISRQKAAEAELKKAHEELERRVAERTAELHVANARLTEKIADLEAFHDVAVGREIKMIELEKENAALRAELTRLSRHLSRC